MSSSEIYPKRLIEVDLPIRQISKYAREEKEMRRGHVPLLYIWPATRPPAACRAIILAALLPDPADPFCPTAFRSFAEKELDTFSEMRGKPKTLKGDWLSLRGVLLSFVADFSHPENANDKIFLQISRALVQCAHDSLSGLSGGRPLVIDPFAGGGAIPLEALRVGAEAFASDLNPVAFLFNKIILEYIPKNGVFLLEGLRQWVAEAVRDAERELSKFYPRDNDGSVPIAYLWCRTVLSEAPDTDDVPIEVPLIRSLWLSKKGTKKALRWIRNSSGRVQTKLMFVTYSDGSTMKVRRPLLEVFEPTTATEVEKGTAAHGAATCPVTGYTTPVASVRAQLRKRRGGARDARLYCVVTTHPGAQGRSYRLPTDRDLEPVHHAQAELERRSHSVDDLALVPDEALPDEGTIGFRVQKYGMRTWGDLFTDRQLLALTTFARLSREAAEKLETADPRAAQLASCVALIVMRLADLNASLCGWQLSTPNTAHLFVRWALPMLLDFGEVNPLAGAGGSPESVLRRIEAGVENIISASLELGTAHQGPAASQPLPDDRAQALITDPPYYDAVPYAALADFFYVWMRRSLPKSVRASFPAALSPKEGECIVDPASYKDRAYFTRTMEEALSESRRVIEPGGIGIVVFAHKATEGWEAQLEAMVSAGWTVTASWPIDTEMASRLRARNSAALASSVHLVCRPRKAKAESIGDWRDVLEQLPRRIHDWMPRLEQEGIVGADAIFACLGPALEIFSRYTRVEKASGQPVKLKEYLEHVWAAVAREALTQIFHGAETAGFEEDARLTAMWLWTLSTRTANGEGAEVHDDEEEEEEEEGSKAKATGFVMEYDAARKIAQGLGAHLETLSTLVEVKGSSARLLPVAERTRSLFQRVETGALMSGKKPRKRTGQLSMGFMADLEAAEETGGWGDTGAPQKRETILDRVHQSMILFGAGRGEALKRFLVDDGAGRDDRFWRLAQALSALYPASTDEKRWIDGVLARKKGLGF
jgi:putative DNA methylase